MPIPVIMPKFEMTQETARVVNWLREEGEFVEKGDPLLEVETDKIVMEVESPAAGILSGNPPGALPEVGAMVPVTEVFAVILMPGESLAEPVRATPVAQRMAAAEGIDLAWVPTADPAGRVTRQDVKRYLQEGKTPPERSTLTVASEDVQAVEKPRATPAARQAARRLDLDLAQISGRLTGSGPHGRIQKADVAAYAAVMASQPGEPPLIDASEAEQELIPLDRMRRTISQRMLQSYQTRPHIHLSVEVDMTAALALRDGLNAAGAESGEGHISLTALLVKMCAWALQRHPQANAMLVENGLRLQRGAHIGVAVALENGLIVPVVHDAQSLSLAQIAARLQQITEKARQGRLSVDDMQGGTFTLSNLGMFGVDQFTAIINPPESAILAIGRVKKKVCVLEGAGGDEIAIRRVMGLTLAVDHRVLDGATAARFLQDIVRVLETPSLLLL